MIQHEVQKTNKFIALGVLAGALAPILSDVAVLFVVVAWIFFFFGCLSFAKAKGYSRGLGIVLGLFGLIGLLILFFMPDKLKAGV